MAALAVTVVSPRAEAADDAAVEARRAFPSTPGHFDEPSVCHTRVVRSS